MEPDAVELVGREAELERLTAFVERAGQGAATLVVEGEPGIGKTALWSAAVVVASGADRTTLVTRPVEAEATLAFTALGDLLEPVLDLVLDELPQPQARALRVALLLEDDERAPDTRALGIAVVGALRSLARAGPVVVAVDDVQWLDASSAAVLRFAVRRLRDEPVRLVLARRPGLADLVESLREDRLERLPLEGLSAGALHRLLHERLGLVLPRPALRRLHELSAGNPFYALELGQAFQRGTMTFERGEALPPSLDALVGERIESLPDETREALAVAAALSRPFTALVGSPDVLAPAVDARILFVAGDEVRFTHPLLAAAAYASLDTARRRDLHRRLAREVRELEERARHLALGATGPDESVAAELARAAAGARSRGAVTTAAELAERAVALTPPAQTGARHERTLLVGLYRFEAGDAVGARRLLDDLVQSSPRGLPRARALADLARVHMFEGARRRAVEVLRSALEHAAEDEHLRILIEYRLTTTLGVVREDLREAHAHARDAVARARRVGDRAILARALSTYGLIGALIGDSHAPAAAEQAVGLERHEQYLFSLERPSFDRAIVLMWTDELDRARALLEPLYQELIEVGDDGSRAWMADNLAAIEFFLGDWEAAVRWVREAHELAAQTGQPAQQAYARAMEALVRAHRGEIEATRASAHEALALSGDEVGIGWMNARWALGLLELSLGDAAAAHKQLEIPSAHAEREQIGEPATTRFLFDDVEALIALRRLDDAERRLAYVEGHARRLDRAFALAVSARCRALLAAAHGDQPAALEWFERALEQHARAARPFDRARTLLAYGAALRRAKRKREARAALDEAAAEFERLGAGLWLERARDELARLGGRAPSGDELTETERRVAQLVAQGLTNREAAAALFVTPKTIEFHLRNVFRKLGVRSRAELARRAP